jgi:2-aminoethylphosphonate-pyruvate transaminase
MKHILLNPGPACTTDAVKHAMVEIGDVCPREIEIGDLMKSISDKTKSILTSNSENYESILLTSSGTGAVEMVISSLPKDSKVLNIVNGSYGERIDEMLKVYNIDHKTLNYKEGSIDFEDIKYHLDNNHFSHISVIHCETTTGIINDISRIGKLAKDNFCELIVDAMSSAFAYPIDMERDGIQFLCCSSNKLVQGMAGLGIVIANKDSLSKCFARTVYLDLKSQFEYFQKTKQMRFTPPVQILNSLDVAIDELILETIEGRYNRYEKLNKFIRREMQSLGFEPLINEDENSIVITSFLEPEGFDFNNFHDYLKDNGFVIYPGKVSMHNTFRLSNIGNITELEITKFIELVKFWVNC